MLRTGILNPQVNHLISRFRHTNLLVIADRGFPYWPEVETVDLSLVDDMPRVLDVFQAVNDACVIGRVYMAEEFPRENNADVREAFGQAFAYIPVAHEPHTLLKKRVPRAIGLIRTGDTIQYANMILESA